MKKKRKKPIEGPLHVDLETHKYGPLIVEIGNSGRPIAFVYPSETANTDAHLLSTAPEGLSLARFIMKKFNQGDDPANYIDDDTYDLVIMARALVSRARGKASS